jgi:16S rRNA (cytidine1402-2'-O)-methyltransferase
MFESPHRIRRTLSDLNVILADRQIYVFRELTKINEESGIYPNIHNTDWPAERGEFTIVVSPGGGRSDSQANESFDSKELVELFQQLSTAQTLSREMAVELVAMRFGRSVAEVRKIVKKAVILAKQQIS